MMTFVPTCVFSAICFTIAGICDVRRQDGNELFQAWPILDMNRPQWVVISEFMAKIDPRI